MKVLSTLNMTSQKIISLADGSNPTDAVNKQQLDNVAAGQSWKQPVRAATTTAGTLATAFANGQTIDGVALTTGARILIKDQAAGAENGIYTVNAAGAPTRATDADTTAELNSATAYVIAGTVNADKAFTQTANDAVVGTTVLAWAQVGGGTAYTAGNGLSLNGTTFAVLPKAGGGLLVDGTGVSVDTAFSGLAKRYSATIGDGTATSIAVTHNLGTKDITWSVQDVTTGEFYLVDAVATSATVLTLTFAVAPGSASIRVVVHA